jgi:hypothetical protein
MLEVGVEKILFFFWWGGGGGGRFENVSNVTANYQMIIL